MNQAIPSIRTVCNRASPTHFTRGVGENRFAKPGFGEQFVVFFQEETSKAQSSPNFLQPEPWKCAQLDFVKLVPIRCALIPGVILVTCQNLKKALMKNNSRCFQCFSEQLPCRSAEVKFFSGFLGQRCREIWREILA